ncbi:MAG: proline dehydrogenase family protein [Mycobacteriaceae bacterium]|uniref:proline dehydrogenase family protein n=1 Tax=Corynebacterium sp. TaxID=1720 RepID=UPI003F95E72A
MITMATRPYRRPTVSSDSASASPSAPTAGDRAATTRPPRADEVEGVVKRSLRLADTWLQVKETSKSTKQLADMVHEPSGVEFTFSFVDRVARPEDNKVAADEFAKIAHPVKRQAPVPGFLSVVDQILMTAGSIAAPLLPQIVMPIARAYLRSVVGHLVLDAEGPTMDTLLDDSRAAGFRLNINLLGEAVLGEDEAVRRRDDLIDLIRNPKVDYISVKASAVVSQLNHWDVDGSAERLKDRLRPLYREALKRSPRPFINMDMEEYKDLDLTLKIFTELLGEEEFLELEAGIVLQAYLPDSFEALRLLTDFAQQRRANGGAKIKVRIVKGANLSMERVDAELHDWPQTPYLTKAEVDANYLRLLDWVLRPENADAIRIGVATHNVFHMAIAHELSVERGVEDQIDAEMLQGMAPAQADAVRDVVGEVILYTPVVKKENFDVAVSYLVRRLEENGAKQNFLYAMFTPESDEETGMTPMEGQRERFLAAVHDRWSTVAGPRRTQDRTEESREHAGTRSSGVPGNFVNEPDTDPDMPANRAWAARILDPASDPGPAVSDNITDPGVIDEAVGRALDAHDAWASTSGADRAAVLDKAADALADNRHRIIAAAVHEAGKTVAQTDPEVSEAIDFCRYYAESARKIDRHRGSTFTPYRTVAVVPPWNFPVAIPVGGCMAALAAGASVLLKPAPQTLRIAEVFVDALREAGITEDMLQLVNADEGDAGKRLVSHPDIDSVIFTGGSDTARMFRSWDPRLVINAETSGKNAIIVTPAADPDLAVSDILASAYGHAGQKCSAASLVITVGSMGKSARFMGQLEDAVKSLRVGPGTDISTDMNGIIEPAGDKLLRGLTRLDKGEKWLVEPEPLNGSAEEATLWSPGLRDNVKPGSWFHTHECFGPVTGVMHADTLEEAIDWQNSTGYGLTAGLHTIDRDETAFWRDRVEAGNIYVERGITGAIVQRQPFGGWKGSSIGSGAKAGGPNYVAQQGHWTEGDISELHSGSVSTDITQLLREFHGLPHPVLTEDDHRWLRRAAESDAQAWASEFGAEHDRTALVVESNVFRYRPLLEPLRVRIGQNANTRDLLRLFLGARVTGTKLDVSATPAVASEMGELANRVRMVSDVEFAADIEVQSSVRVRTLGDVDEALYDAAARSGSVVLDRPVLPDGRRELLPMLLEQAVTTTEHRFGYIHGTTP